MARKQLKTARGRTFDMDQFTNDKGKTLALGNLGGGRPVNAKGDILGTGGVVEVKREEAVRQYYREELPKTTRTPISDESMVSAPAAKTETVFQSPEAAMHDLAEASVEKEAAEAKTTRRSKKGK